jgi:hypothetical protein
MLEFLAGMILGGAMGVFIAALCVAASREDRP